MPLALKLALGETVRSGGQVKDGQSRLPGHKQQRNLSQCLCTLGPCVLGSACCSRTEPAFSHLALTSIGPAASMTSRLALENASNAGRRAFLRAGLHGGRFCEILILQDSCPDLASHRCTLWLRHGMTYAELARLVWTRLPEVYSTPPREHIEEKHAPCFTVSNSPYFQIPALHARPGSASLQWRPQCSPPSACL